MTRLYAPGRWSGGPAPGGRHGVQPVAGRAGRRRRRARPRRRSCSGTDQPHLRRAGRAVRPAGRACWAAPGSAAHRDRADLAAVGVGPGPPRPLPAQRPRVPRGDARRLRRPGGAVQRELPLRRRGAALPARRLAGRRRSSTTRPSPRCWPRSAPTCPTSQLLLQVADDSGHDLLPGAPLVRGRAGRGAGRRRPPVEPSPDDLYILYTGGTTGMPKGVLWRQADIFPAALGGPAARHRRGVADLDAIVENARNGGTRILPAAPFMHGAAHWLALNALGQGNTVVLPERRDDLRPGRRVAAVEREGVSIVLIVGDAFGRPAARRARPARLRPLVAGPAHQRRRRAVGAGEGGPARPHPGHGDHGRRWARRRPAPRPARSPAPAPPARTGTFTPGAGMAIVSEDLTRLLEPGHRGAGLAGPARAGSRSATSATRTRPRARSPTIDGVRYSVPGDRARVTADGLLELHGRDSVTINSGGEKIFAEEVEAALAHHPDVYDVVVAGRPSDRWGQEVVAVVQLREGFDVSDRRAARRVRAPHRPVQAAEGDPVRRPCRALPRRQGRLPLGPPHRRGTRPRCPAPDRLRLTLATSAPSLPPR